MSIRDKELPSEFDDVIIEISDAIENGFVCYLNPDTMELEQVADEGIGIPESEYAEQNDDMIDEFGMSFTQWDTYVKFEPFSGNDLLIIMEKFINLLNDKHLKSQLENMEDRPQFIEDFDGIMERTGRLEEWNEFKRDEIEYYVRNKLVSSLRNKIATDESVY